MGRPHIALAELVKNAYDADATRTRIIFGDDRIEVTDDGHGMTLDEFSRFWMRIGSTHKDAQATSRLFGRPLTGSKGIGRLSVQFLASGLELRTTAETDPSHELVARINWREAITAGDLTQVEVAYEILARSDADLKLRPHGTTIVLTRLNHAWTPEDFGDLAREVRTLQPPFRPNPRLTSESQRGFEVALEAPDPEIRAAFDKQMSALLQIWTARLVGRLETSNAGAAQVKLALEFEDRQKRTTSYPVNGAGLHALDFEIRVFTLARKQPRGVRVDEARDYFRRFGGVHVYDAGFHLPYYGAASDWLEVEIDHSHRLSVSKLLPDELQVPDGMNFLPTNSRLFGVVNIDTAEERRLARATGDDRADYLAIQVTRDRLVDNGAYGELKAAVRWALDFYAMQEARRQFAVAERKKPTLPFEETTHNLAEILSQHREEMPKKTYDILRREASYAVAAAREEKDKLVSRVALLGTLATAGMATLAYEHEAAKQLSALDRLLADLRRDQGPDAKTVSGQLEHWIQGARDTRALFRHLLSEKDRNRDVRLSARVVVRRVLDQTRPFLRGVQTETESLAPDLLLPAASYAEWVAIFQNIFVNASNAMLDSERRLIRVTSRGGRDRYVQVEDTGEGVDLDTAEDLFEPFARRIEISTERQALGLGGTGLGLTIVRMLAENLGARVSFVEPIEGFSTALRLAWREK